MSRDVPPILPDFIDPDDLAVLGDAECPAFSGDLMRYEATVQAAEERVRTSEAERFLLRLAILSARDLMGAAHREPRPGIAHDLRVGADKILHDALAADDAARGER